MSLTAAVIAELVAAGLSGEALVSACERIEAAQPMGPSGVRTARQERNARYYASQKRLRASQSDVSDAVSDAGPSDLPPPVSPLFPSPKPLTKNPPLSPTNPQADAGAKALDGELLLPIAKPKPPPSQARSCRIPPSFPGGEEREWTKLTLRFTDDDFEECGAEFRDYWSGVPGQRGVKCDWPATFRNAARKYRPRSGSRQTYAPGNQRSDGSLLAAYQRGSARAKAANDVSRQRGGVFDHRERDLEMQYGIPAE